MNNEPILKIIFEIDIIDNKFFDENDLFYVADQIISCIYDELESNTVYVNESGINVKPNFGLNGYYETSETFEDDEGEVSLYLDHRDKTEIKKIKEDK